MCGFFAEVFFEELDVVVMGDGVEAFLIVWFGGEECDVHGGGSMLEVGVIYKLLEG